MPKHLEIGGQRFGKLVAVTRAPTPAHVVGRKSQPAYWRCACDCGGELVTKGETLRSGRAASCGCSRATPTKHGHASGGKKSPTLGSWAAMRARCSDPRQKSYDRYGGRGIKVCERWADFSNFLADMGECPPGRSIERRDIDGNYEPGNCYWLPLSEQGLNTSRTVWVKVDGELMTLTQASERLNRPNGMLWRWLKQTNIPRKAGVNICLAERPA